MTLCLANPGNSVEVLLECFDGFRERTWAACCAAQLLHTGRLHAVRRVPNYLRSLLCILREDRNPVLNFCITTMDTFIFDLVPCLA